MQTLGGSEPAVGFAVKRKRSSILRIPRANSDALFQSYFSFPSFLEPFGKDDENENVRDITIGSDGLGTVNKMKKLKLKFGGVTRTIHTKLKTELDSSCGSYVTNFFPCDDGAKPQDDTDGNHACPSDKRKAFGEQKQKLSGTGSGFVEENHACGRKTSRETKTVAYEPVRKSTRIPKKCALDVAFSDEANEDAEFHFLERLNASKVALSCNEYNQGPGIEHGTCKVVEQSKVGGTNEHGMPSSSKKNLKSEKQHEDQDYMVEEDQTSDDDSMSEKKTKKESIDLVVRGKKYFQSSCYQLVDSSKNALSGSDASSIEISDGMAPISSQRKKCKLTETAQQLKKAEAAQRRKIQSEKAAREAEAEAIRKILAQDSNRKKKEEKMKKQRDEFAQGKSINFNLGSNTVRWTMGPTGTVVTFSEDIGLPSIFQMVPNSYPPPREKCAAPNCTNVYKYRDSKSKLPLCSLICYRAIHGKMKPLIAC